MTVTLEQTQQDLARWLAIARQGEEVVITQDGESVAKLVGVPPRRVFTAEENARWIGELETLTRTVGSGKINMTIQDILDDDRGD